MIINLLISVFLGATIVQLFFWNCLFARLAKYKEANQNIPPQTEKAVSIIICAKNEAENLKKNLPHILNQNYRSFEVIVVNDNSTDSTLDVLLDFKEKNAYLRIINFSNTKKGQVGKKFALTEGIKAAQNENLLLTDADCQPATNQWLQKMQSLINQNSDIEIGLGYGPYFEASGFLNTFIRYETVYTAIQYFSFALIGQAYMGVGRNLLYQKKLFHQTKGFVKHEHIASGDDDLFINEVARRNNVAITLNENTFVYSEPKTTWRSFYRQKSRHLSTGTSYQSRHKLLLGAISASHFLHYFAGIILAIKFSIMFAGVIYTVRIITLVYWYAPILKKMKEQSLLLWIPILDAVHVLYYLIFLPKLFIGKKNKWT